MGKKIIWLILTIYLTGCASLLSKVDKLYLDTDENASIIIINYSFTGSAEVIEPFVSIYIQNIETKKETKIVFGDHRVDLSATTYKSVVMNLPAGSYEFVRWEYDACKKMDKYQLFCKEWYGFKGKTPKPKHAKFQIKKGETLYLGHFRLNTNDAILNHYKSSNNFKFKDREVRNISNSIDIDDWQFEMTGYKGLLDFAKGIGANFQ